MQADNNTERHILEERFQTSRGLGLPEGTVLILGTAPSGVVVVDYTTPHGSYGNFIPVDAAEVTRLKGASYFDVPRKRRRRGRGRGRAR